MKWNTHITMFRCALNARTWNKYYTLKIPRAECEIHCGNICCVGHTSDFAHQHATDHRVYFIGLQWWFLVCELDAVLSCFLSPLCAVLPHQLFFCSFLMSFWCRQWVFPAFFFLLSHCWRIENIKSALFFLRDKIYMLFRNNLSILICFLYIYLLFFLLAQFVQRITLKLFMEESEKEKKSSSCSI